jgi:hypothetical protein
MVSVKLKKIAPHYYVGRASSRNDSGRARLRPADVCIREGCGRPSEDPVHLCPPGDAPVERKAATG